MYSCAQVQPVSSFPVIARSTPGQRGYQPLSKSTYAAQLARRTTSASKAPLSRNRRYTTTASAGPVGELALLPSLFPVVLRAFSAGLLLYSSLRWVSARADRQQAERNIAEMQTRQAEQKAKLDRLRGTTGSSDKDATK
ncbi:hypothetical protein ABBQ38_012521 [Trebouxia sp. C0009 RCD-2024]